LAYVAEADNKPFVVVDGKEEKYYDRIGVGGPIFSPDSMHLAYVAEAGDQWFVVVDGEEGNRYNGVATLEGGKALSGSFDSLYCFCIEDKGIYLVEVKTSPLVRAPAGGQVGSLEP
jgi:hypothetical protein